MARVRMTVEVAIDEEKLKEKNVFLEDVVEGIRFHSHDTIDGFEITTDIPGCDCSSDFFLVSGDITEIEVIEAPAKSRLEKINGYKDNEEFLKSAAEQELANKTDTLVSQIRALKPRIDELIELGNACLANGIELDTYHEKGWFNSSNDSYERGTFVTNGITHRVGFVRPRGVSTRGPHQFEMLGITNGGACGSYDFRTDGERVCFIHENNMTDIKGPSYKTQDLEKFLKNFNEFETAFYDYVDKVVEKQQNAVDKIISEAAERSEKTDTGVSGKDSIIKE